MKQTLSINRALAVSGCALMLVGQLLASITCLSVCSFPATASSASDAVPCSSCCSAPAPQTSATTSTLTPCKDCPMPCCVNTDQEQLNAALQNHRVASPAVVTLSTKVRWAGPQPKVRTSPQFLPPASPPPPLYRMHCALLT